MNATIVNDRTTRPFERDELHGSAGKFQERETWPTQSDEIPTEILVPMDFSACAFNALRTAVRFAQRYGARITLLYVMDVNLTYRVDITRIERNIIVEGETNFAQIIESLSASVCFATKIVRGRPFEQILKVARKQGIKLIIMGKRKPTFWNFFHRQTVRRVMENASCDVIAVAEEKKQNFKNNHQSELTQKLCST